MWRDVDERSQMPESLEVLSRALVLCRLPVPSESCLEATDKDVDHKSDSHHKTGGENGGVDLKSYHTIGYGDRLADVNTLGYGALW